MHDIFVVCISLIYSDFHASDLHNIFNIVLCINKFECTHNTFEVRANYVTFLITITIKVPAAARIMALA